MTATIATDEPYDDGKTPARRAVDRSLDLAITRTGQKTKLDYYAAPYLQTLVYAILDVADAIREGQR